MIERILVRCQTIPGINPGLKFSFFLACICQSRDEEALRASIVNSRGYNPGLLTIEVFAYSTLTGLNYPV